MFSKALHNFQVDRYQIKVWRFEHCICKIFFQIEAYVSQYEQPTVNVIFRLIFTEIYFKKNQKLSIGKCKFFLKFDVILMKNFTTYIVFKINVFEFSTNCKLQFATIMQNLSVYI